MRVSVLLVVMAVLTPGCGGDSSGDEESGGEAVGEAVGGDVSLSTAFEPDPPAAVQPVTWALTVRNGSVEAVTLTFPSGKRGDVVLRDERDKIVYRWSDGKFFTEAVSRHEVGPGQEVVYRLEDPALGVEPGDYELEATLAAEPQVGPDRQRVRIR